MEINDDDVNKLMTALTLNNEYDEELKETNAADNIIGLLKYINSSKGNANQLIAQRILNLDIRPSHFNRFLHIRNKVIRQLFINANNIENYLKQVWLEYNNSFKIDNYNNEVLPKNFNTFANQLATDVLNYQILCQAFIITSIYFFLSQNNNQYFNILQRSKEQRELFLYYYQLKFSSLIFDIENLYSIATDYINNVKTNQTTIKHPNLEMLKFDETDYLYETLENLSTNLDQNIKNYIDNFSQNNQWLNQYFDTINDYVLKIRLNKLNR